MANMPLSAPPVLQKVSGIPASQAGINKDGSANTAGVKNLGYGYSSTGDINTAPWHANTYQDSVNNIGKYSTDLNANREALVQSSLKSGNWDAYNQFNGAQGQQSQSNGIGVSAGGSMPLSGGNMPQSSGGYATPKFDAVGIAASRVAAQRAALAGSVAAYDTSRKSAFDYMTKNTQDQRTLDNAMFKETNNPFSGKYQYDTTNTLRNNGIQDTQNQTNYQNDIAASDAKLAAFDAGSAGMQQDIQQQLEQQNFTNNLASNQDTRAQQGQDHNFLQDTFSNNRLTANDTYSHGQDTITNNRNAANDTATYTGNYTSPQSSAIQQQMAKNSAAYASASPAEQQRLHDENLALSKQLGQTYDPGTGTYSGGNTSTRTIVGQNADLNQTQTMATLTGYMSDGRGGYVPTNAKQQQDLTDAWKESENMGTVSPSLSRLTGIPVGTMTQAAKNQAIQNGISQQNANTSSKNANTSATNSNNSQNNIVADNARADAATASKGYQDTFANLKYLYTAKDADTGSIKVTNPASLRSAIIAKNMTDAQTIQMLTDFGLPIHP